MVFHLFIIPELDVFALFKLRKPPDDGVSSFEKKQRFWASIKWMPVPEKSVELQEVWP